MKWNLTSIVFISKTLPILLCLLMLSGCIGYPVADKTNENQYYGFLPGEDGEIKDREESIIEEEYSSGMQWVFSAEGPRRVVHGDTVVRNYYLKKGSNKISLPFLALADPTDSWNQFYYINNAWYGFKYEPVKYQVDIIKFTDELMFEKNIKISPSGKESTLLLDRDGKYLVWQYESGETYRYNLGDNKEKKIGSKLPANLVELFIFDFSTPETDSEYDDRNFLTILEKIKQNSVGKKRIYNLVRSAYTTMHYDELDTYSESKFEVVRWAVAENPATPFYILWVLEKDKNVYVANAAKKRLKK